MCSLSERKYELMKTILHTIDTTGPGGAETVFIDLATNLPLDKYRSVVLIRGKGWVYEELCRRGMQPTLLDTDGSFNWRYLKSLVALIRREKVDLIQSHLLGSNVYCALAGLITRTPVVATFHGAVDIGENERLKWLKFSAINFGVNIIVAVSYSLRKNIVNRTHLRDSKIEVICNGIKTDDFHRSRSDTLRQQYGWSSDDVIIGSLGNIRPAKAYDILLHAAARLKYCSHNFRFVIAGHAKEPLYTELLKLKDELGLDDIVHFIGFIDNPADFLSNLDIFLLSSSSEGFSIATIQAMAAGLPVVATRSGGPEEIITHETNGLLVDSGDPKSIAEALKKLNSDRKFSQILAKAGQEHATNTFDVKNMIDAYEKIYNSSIGW